MALTSAQMAEIHALCFDIPRPWSTEEINAQLELPGALVLFEHQSFLLARDIAGEAEVLTLAVHPDQRRKGMATKLMEMLITRVDAASIVLEVAADNDAARALYTQQGFVEVGCRKGYYAGTDALILRREAVLKAPT